VATPNGKEEHMMIGDRLRDLREAKHLSQGDIEQRTGLLRCYVSRVEHGHTVPCIETLEKLAHALEVPMYQFFYDGEKPPQVPTILHSSKQKHIRDWASRGKGLRVFTKIRQALSRMSAVDRSLLMHMARKVSHESRGNGIIRSRSIPIQH
jgi:transcriptional regulator with XRE-family HTH domain